MVKNEMFSNITKLAIEIGTAFFFKFFLLEKMVTESTSIIYQLLPSTLNLNDPKHKII